MNLRGLFDDGGDPVGRPTGYSLRWNGKYVVIAVNTACGVGFWQQGWNMEASLRSHRGEKHYSGEEHLAELRREEPLRYHLYRLGMDELLYRRT